MKISTKGRYALRLMVDLAQCKQGKNVALKEVAARQGISLKYLEQIITVLTKAGYVLSARGSNGGYRLAHEPEYYTVGMILRLTEGSLAPVACLEGNEIPVIVVNNVQRFLCGRNSRRLLTMLLTTLLLPTLLQIRQITM